MNGMLTKYAVEEPDVVDSASTCAYRRNTLYEARTMARWEYLEQYVKLDRKQARSLEGLEQQGSDGWELVSAVPLPRRARRSSKADVLLVFKRPEASGKSDKGRKAPSNSAAVETAEAGVAALANGKNGAAEPVATSAHNPRD